MEPTLLALKLYLDALGVPDTIDTMADRKLLQKAVYIGQLTGADLGYRFSWYVKGPYSPGLTRDYYSLKERIETTSVDLASQRLRPVLQERLARVQPLLDVPSTVPLSKDDWLELVASVDYLHRVSRKSDDETERLLNEQKPHLVQYLDDARAALDSFRNQGIIR